MYRFIKENTFYPEAEKKAGIEGTVEVSFIVEKDGSISDISVLKGVPGGQGLDKEAIRIIEIMPAWVPAKNSGYIVRQQYRLPIVFSLDKNGKK
jgi:periplasmic protein TonB